jgi:hypothetical protein
MRFLPERRMNHQPGKCAVLIVNLFPGITPRGARGSWAKSFILDRGGSIYSLSEYDKSNFCCWVVFLILAEKTRVMQVLIYSTAPIARARARICWEVCTMAISTIAPS